MDFKNAVIIMTSNIGSPIIQEYFNVGNLTPKEHAEMENKVKLELRAHFRPEFLNRVDDIIIFHSLQREQLIRIVDIQLERVAKRLQQQNLQLELDPSAKALIAQEGYDPQFGARPLKRSIQEHLLDPLATQLLEGKFKPGDRIRATAHDSELVFEKA